MSKQILVIENDADLSASVADNLEAAGYRVLGPTARGLDAFRLCEASGGVPDVALVDIRLDDKIDGIFLGQELVERGVRVIYLTGYFDRAVNEGRDHAHGMLRKPFSPSELERAIADALARPAPDVAG